MNYFVVLIATVCACLASQFMALQAIGGRTVKSESNYFSSLGRIQAGTSGNPRIMLLGSSITGRLPDRTQGFREVVCMGCDGGSAADTIRAIDEGRLPRAPILIVEANTLAVALAGESQIASAMRKPWFQAGIRVPLISAYARPAAFLYSPLLSSRTGTYNTLPAEDLGVNTLPVTPSSRWMWYEVDDKQRSLIDDISPRLMRLEQKGSRVILVWLPPGRSNDDPPPSWILKLALEAGAEWWDLGQDAAASEVTLTDQIHMDAESAAKTLRSILTALSSAQQSPEP